MRDGQPNDVEDSESREAAVWAVRLDGSAIDSATQQSLEVWLASSPRRVGQLLRAQAAMTLVTGRPPQASQCESKATRATGRRAWLAAGLAACVTGLLVISTWRFLLPSEEIVTLVGETRQLLLPDRSKMHLDGDTLVAVSMSTNARSVELGRGRAHFTVAHESNRPFKVFVGDFEVVDIGTSFIVDLNSGLDVIVTEGSVEIRRDGTRTLVSVGHRFRATSGKDPEVTQLDAAGLSRALSWKEGVLEFDADSLADAVVAFNRQNRQRIEVIDPTLFQRAIHGRFRSDDPMAFSGAVGLAFDVPVVAYADRILIGR